MNTNKFLGEWEKKTKGLKGIAALRRDFNITKKDIKEEEVLLAYYDRDEYEGSAFVLFLRNGTLYEVNGSHCSCYGLEEDQWEIDDTNIEVLRHRLTEGTLGLNYYEQDCFASLLSKILDNLESEIKNNI
jgi:hypothetical protein